MVSSRAATVKEYLEELPADRRKVIAKVRSVVNKSLPKGYQETMNWGMICWEIPLSRYPVTYNKQPLGIAALAAQKNNYTLYLGGTYADPAQRKQLEAAFKSAGRKMDMGKSCLHFKALDDIPLEAIGKILSTTPPEKVIALYEASRKPAKPRRAG